MDPLYGLPIIVALVVGFIAVRRMILRRRRSLQAYTRTRDERLKKSRPKDRRTSRAEMRASDSPTTVMDSMRSGSRRGSRDKDKKR